MKASDQNEVVVRRAGANDVRSLLQLIKRFAVESGESPHAVSGEATLAKALAHLTRVHRVQRRRTNGLFLGHGIVGGARIGNA